VGDKVKRGDIITEWICGHRRDIQICRKRKAENYIIAEVNKIYELQGETVSRKHIESIVRQMFAPKKDRRGWRILPSRREMLWKRSITSQKIFRLKEKGKEEQKLRPWVMGISEVSFPKKLPFSRFFPAYDRVSSIMQFGRNLTDGGLKETHHSFGRLSSTVPTVSPKWQSFCFLETNQSVSISANCIIDEDASRMLERSG